MNTQSHYLHPKLWQKAFTICTKLYKVSNKLPIQERSGMYRKLRDDSEIIPEKISCGVKSIYINDYIDSLSEVLPVLERLNLQMLLARELEYVSEENFTEIRNDIQKLVYDIKKMIQNLDILNSALNPSFAYAYFQKPSLN